MDHTASAIEQAHTRRYWQTRPEPLPLWPTGGLLLAALVILFLWGLFSISRSIEGTIEREVAARLSPFGVTPEQVSASGQNVTVTSLALARTDQNDVHAYAASTQCETWLGSIVCPTSVTLNASGEEERISDTQPQEPVDSPDYDASKLPEIAPSLVTVEPAVVLPRDHDFRFATTGDRIVLRGEVPDDATRSNVLSAAQRRFASVTDELITTGERARAGYNNAAARAIELLAQLERGQTYWISGELSANGLVLPESENSARSTFARIANAPKLGKLSLTTARTLDACDQAFADALAASTINFATGSSVIADESQNLLQALAELAGQCPGGLMIEGHTDSVGDADANQALSEARAAAVVTALHSYGIDSARLQSSGYGESAPIAENTSANGRAANRRIVIRTTALNLSDAIDRQPQSSVDTPMDPQGESP
ncbi:MAG: OmpA family protein [Pseudomonadaceae bacterium]|nr:OmpA family protein [Pseudomonadaceae bacterium]